MFFNIFAYLLCSLERRHCRPEVSIPVFPCLSFNSSRLWLIGQMASETPLSQKTVNRSVSHPASKTRQGRRATWQCQIYWPEELFWDKCTSLTSVELRDCFVGFENIKERHESSRRRLNLIFKFGGSAEQRLFAWAPIQRICTVLYMPTYK